MRSRLPSERKPDPYVIRRAQESAFEDVMKKKSSAFPLALEGLPFLLSAATITVLLFLLSFTLVSLVGLCVTLFVAYFFRNPERTAPADPDAVVAPADGVVIYVGKAREEHLDAEMLKISIFMSVFNVHVNRAPFSGRVLDTFYKQGKFFDARDNRATFENEQSGIILQTEKGTEIVFVQVAGLIARRIVSYPNKGDLLRRAERYGLIRFGSRVDIYLPQNTDLAVALGDKTVAGETVLGYLR